MWRIFNPFARGAELMSPKNPKQGRKRKWVKGKPANKEIHGVKWVEPGFVEFRNVVEKIESEALERMTREADVEMEDGAGVF
jgi:hypothetical protein